MAAKQRRQRKKKPECLKCEWILHAGGNIWYCPFIEGTCAYDKTEGKKHGKLEDSAGR